MFSLAFLPLLLSLYSSTVTALPQGTNDPGAQLKQDLTVVQAFGKKVTSDPAGHTKSWTGSDVCKFDGVFCDTPPTGNLHGKKSVASLDFNGFNLGDNLPLGGLIDKLPGLALFHANSNGFLGGIPDLSGLQYLYELDVSNNHLSGRFPQTVLGANLTFLDLRFNQFTGPLPPALFTGGQETIYLNNNGFNGELPSNNWGTKAKYLTAANNQFAGKIPTQVAAPNLQEVLLLGNQLTGPVPESLCGIKTLTTLDLSNNKINEKLGPQCEALRKKGVLKVDGNIIPQE